MESDNNVLVLIRKVKGSKKLRKNNKFHRMFEIEMNSFYHQPFKVYFNGDVVVI